MVDNLPAEIYSDIKQAIIIIAEGLKVPAEMLLTTIVKQGVVESISNIFLMTFFLILSFVYTKTFSPMWKSYFLEYDPSHGEHARNVFTMMISGILWFIFFMFTICNMTETITGLVNPEYRAIEIILSMIKK